MKSLSSRHLAELRASAITEEVATERGYATVDDPGEAFSVTQRRLGPGLLIPIRDVTGAVRTWQFKPDAPRITDKNKPVKYETAPGRLCLDVPPRARSFLGVPSEPLWITEGCKKSDAAISNGIRCIIGVLGVWNWRGTNASGGKAILPDWESIALNDRIVNVAFDSDVMVKPPVREAIDRLAAWLDSRGAHVRFVLMPCLSGGEKSGLDDFLASGHTITDLEACIVETLPDEPDVSLSSLFTTAHQLAASIPDQIEWIAKPYVAIAAVTELDGRAKQAGKTTFALDLCASVLRQRHFMGFDTAYTPIVYLTEQSGSTFREVLRRADLLESTDLHILPWHSTAGRTWAEIVAATQLHAESIGARLVVVDTLPQFAGIRGDAENDSGQALALMEPVQRMAASGIAVVIIRHDRKGGGDVGESGRGSTAFAGAVDIILRLSRPEGVQRDTIRHLDSLSRFDETPDRLVIEWVDGRFTALGTEASVATAAAKVAVLEAVPESEADALTEADVLKIADVRRTLGRSVLLEHVQSGAIIKIGTGKRGDPYRYWRPNHAEKLSGTRFHAESETNSGDVIPVQASGQGGEGKSGRNQGELLSDTLRNVVASESNEGSVSLSPTLLSDTRFHAESESKSGTLGDDDGSHGADPGEKVSDTTQFLRVSESNSPSPTPDPERRIRILL